MEIEDTKDAVIRISKENHRRLKSLMGGADDKKKTTINELMEKLLDTMETIENGKMIYVVGENVFDKVSIARGESVKRAVKEKEIPVWPLVAVIVGEDDGV